MIDKKERSIYKERGIRRVYESGELYRKKLKKTEE
jgi:hypothetical protein